MTDKQFLEFNRRWIGAFLSYLIEGGIFGTFIDWRGLPIVHSAAIELGLSPLNLIVRSKTNAGMGSLARLTQLPEKSRTEAIDLATKSTATMAWVPNPGPQTQAFLCEADELFYGGEAGGGKMI